MKSISTENTITHTFMIKGGIMNFIISCMAISVKAALGGLFWGILITIILFGTALIATGISEIYKTIKG